MNSLLFFDMKCGGNRERFHKLSPSIFNEPASFQEGEGAQVLQLAVGQGMDVEKHVNKQRVLRKLGRVGDKLSS